MSLLTKCNQQLAVILSKKSKFDGRFLLLGLLGIYFLPILVANALHIPYNQWRHFWWLLPGVNKMTLPFGDLRVITSGLECYQLGYDALVNNPCDPWKRTMNYPRIWSLLAQIGLNQSHTILLGIICIVTFFVLIFILIGKLNQIEAFIYALIIFSPSIMVAIERGNNDLICYIILGVSIILLKKYNLFKKILASILLLFASILKLYPVFAFISILKNKKEDFFIFLSVLSAFIIYIIFSYKSLILVSEATPRPTKLAYGGQVIFAIILKNLQKKLGFSLAEITNLKPQLILFLICLIIIVILAYKKAQNNYQANLLNCDYIDSFRIGSAIYLGTFLIGNNYDYRLVFLLLTVPQILDWIKNKHPISEISLITLMAIISTLYLSSVSANIGGNFVYLEETINWLIFFCLSYTFMLTLPNFWQSKLKLKPSNRF